MRNIVFIAVDTLRQDHLGCYGYQRPTSPFLDSLAQKSLVLDSCYSVSNFTAPAFTSLFTATYPSQHGIFDFFKQARGSLVKSCLDANKVRAEGVVSFRYFRKMLGNIWGEIEAVTRTRSYDYSKDLPRAVSDGAIEWLERHGKNGPFCLFLHYDGPHIPYRLPDDYAEMFDSADAGTVDRDILNAFFPQHLERIEGQNGDKEAIVHLQKIVKSFNTEGRDVDKNTRRWFIDKYDASIRYTDDMIARVYEALRGMDLLDDTIICVISDHGEEFWEHGRFGHADVNVYEEIIRTVGLIHDPVEPEGRRTDVPVSHVQILPSLLRLAGASPLYEALGALDIGATLERRENGGPAEPVFCTGVYKSVVRLDNMKWIHTQPNRHDSLLKRARLLARTFFVSNIRDELFDLSSDPHENINLGNDRIRVRPMAALLDQHFAENAVKDPIGDPDSELDNAEREQIEKELRDLGYL